MIATVGILATSSLYSGTANACDGSKMKDEKKPAVESQNSFLLESPLKKYSSSNIQFTDEQAARKKRRP